MGSMASPDPHLGPQVDMIADSCTSRACINFEANHKCHHFISSRDSAEPCAELLKCKVGNGQTSEATAARTATGMASC